MLCEVGTENFPLILPYDLDSSGEGDTKPALPQGGVSWRKHRIKDYKCLMLSFKAVIWVLVWKGLGAVLMWVRIFLAQETDE